MKIFADGILKGHVAFVTGGGTGITGGVARAGGSGRQRRARQSQPGTSRARGPSDQRSPRWDVGQ